MEAFHILKMEFGRERFQRIGVAQWKIESVFHEISGVPMRDLLRDGVLLRRIDGGQRNGIRLRDRQRSMNHYRESSIEGGEDATTILLAAVLFMVAALYWFS